MRGRTTYKQQKQHPDPDPNPVLNHAHSLNSLEEYSGVKWRWTDSVFGFSPNMSRQEKMTVLGCCLRHSSHYDLSVSTSSSSSLDVFPLSPVNKIPNQRYHDPIICKFHSFAYDPMHSIMSHDLENLSLDSTS